MEKVKRVNSGEVYEVLSIGEFHLNTFSEHGSLHFFPMPEGIFDVKMEFFGEGRYAGPIVIYRDTDARVWLTPRYEFNALFVKVDE